MRNWLVIWKELIPVQVMRRTVSLNTKIQSYPLNSTYIVITF